MSSETAVEIAFAAAVVVAGAAVGGTLAGRAPRRVLAGLAALLGIGAAAGWIVFALDTDSGTAVAAGGLTLCAAVVLLTIPLGEALARSGRIDAELEAAETRLREVAERETKMRTEELERTLARARADSSSQFAEEERRLAEARRNELVERERRISSELGEAVGKRSSPSETMSARSMRFSSSRMLPGQS